ncbi:MAG: SDR family NAD(P)-dependent oxidoreductase [Sphingobium sp.]
MTEELDPAGRIALVTGANKGIGFEIAKAPSLSSATVLVGARDADAGEAAASAIRAQGGIAEHIRVDLTDVASIEAAARLIGDRYGRLDILVNNVGISVEERRSQPSETDVGLMRQTYETNVFGNVAMLTRMLSLLHKSDAGRIVNMSTGLASFALTAGPDAPFANIRLLSYSSSKAALNAITVMFANELRDSGIKVNAANPGLCATDISSGHGRPASEGAQIAVRLALLGPDGPTGGFFGDNGAVPW